MNVLPRLTVWVFPILCTAMWTSDAQAQCQYGVTVIQAPECPVFGFPPTIGLGANDSGHVVGYQLDCDFETNEAFVWTPQSGHATLALPAGTFWSRAHDINNMKMGQIVGTLDIQWH